MDTPLNEKIDRTLKRKAARKKNDSNFLPVLSLHQQVLSLVKEANSKVPQERRVTPRSALIVMNRSLANLSSLDNESKNFAILKEVSRFLNVATKTFTASQTDNTDLLVAGHPLSTLNASLSGEEFLKKNAQWIAADPFIDESVRPLVASAHGALPGSLEREHAFARLNASKTLTAAYFKVDNLSPIIASFFDGNSSAARRARVALQWRDRFGRWVKMGLGIDFKYRMPNGSVVTANGVYVGAGADSQFYSEGNKRGIKASTGIVEVKGDTNLPDGLYEVNSSNAEVFQARIPGSVLPAIKKKDASGNYIDAFNQDVPSLEQAKASLREAPTGWKKVSSSAKGTTTFTSDENYGAVINNSTGEISLYRLDENGKQGEKIGTAKNWGETNKILDGDENAFDAIQRNVNAGELPLDGKPIARLTRAQIEAADAFKRAREGIQNREEDNKKIDQALAVLQSGKDANGNTVPKEWQPVLDSSYEISYTRQIGKGDTTYPFIASIDSVSGEYYFGISSGWNTDKNGQIIKYDSWQSLEKDIPQFVDYVNSSFAKDNPIEYTPPTAKKITGEPPTPPSGGGEPPAGMKLDFADPEQAARDAGLPADASFNDIAKAWFDQNIKPVAPTAKLDGFEEGGPDGPSVSITADNDEDLLNAFRVYFGDDEATLEDLRDNSEEYSKKDLVEIDKATLDALDKRMREDSTGEYSMEGVTFSSNNNGDIIMYPDGWEPGDKIIGRIEDDGGIDWESDEQYDKYAEKVSEALRGLGGDGPGEPPTPPSGGTPPKTPSPNVPSAPGLFNGFNVPDGAFKLNTVDYEPEGRIDEKSSDYTDVPKIIATRYAPQEIVRAMSQALLGNSSDAALAEILNANVDDNNDIVDPVDAQDSVNIPQVNVGQPSGAGQLEFNAGAEFVPAEALFNALWEAGLDPNRVIANIYDSANGNNDNLNKLIEAQGGVPSAEEAQLVDDIVQEVRQLKDATAPGDSPIANQKQSSSPDPLPGSLIENIPIDFNNPDYYIPNPEAYIPSQPTVDENGYTDNPEIVSADYEVADLIEQMLSGITDGSGAALLAFDNITVEVPIEAIRDALQYRGINTNQILLDLKKESNDMSDDPGDLEDMIDNLGDPDLPAKPSGMPEQISNKKIKDLNDGEFELNLVKIGDIYEGALINKGNGRIQIVVRDKNLQEAKRALKEAGEYIKQAANGDESMDDGMIPNLDSVVQTPETPTLQAHSQMITDLIEQAGNTVDPETADKIRDAIDEKGLLDWSEADDAEIIDAITEVAGTSILEPAPTPAGPPTTGQRQAPETPLDSADKPRDPSVDAPAAEELPAAPSLVYPGPENRGYHPDNTVLDIAGKVMGNGTRIRASRDGRTGTVIAVQNIDSRTGERTPYVRVRFDDGSIAVRSALKVRATGDAQQAVPNGVQPQAPTPPPIPDVSSRLDAPILNPGAIATEGNIKGVNDLGTTPDRLKEFVNPDAKQSDYSVWGLRAGEIARAGRDRVKLESIKQAAINHQLAILEFRSAPESQKQALSLEIIKQKEIIDAMVKDTYGVRSGVTFGKNKYSLSFNGVNVFISGAAEELQAGTQPISLSIAMNVLDSNGRSIGSINRTVSGKQVADLNTGVNIFEWQVKNNYLAINNAKDKKSGFATAYNRFMEDWYIANGIKEIHVLAAGGGSYQGGFVWALNGFNWETTSSAESEVFTRLRLMRRVATNKGEIAQIDRLIEKANTAKLPNGGLDLDKTPTPMELALVGWYPDAKTWTGKDVMTRNGWQGVKRLDTTAKEQVQAGNYDQIRAARKRIEAKENKPNISREFVMTANSNAFENKNPNLIPYLVEIRDVLQNNRSLAFLSPAAKTALNTYVTSQLLTKEGRDLQMQDIFQLRKALRAESIADNPLLNSTDFGVGTALASASIEDVSNNNVKGFDIKRLGMYESGYNETWLATHTASGQRFYVKQDDLATSYGINGPVAEIAATNIARGLGFEGVYNAVAGVDNPNVIVMQEAGAALPLGSEVKVASKVYDGYAGRMTAADGRTVSFNASNFVASMHTPEDAARIVLLDLLINNQDRHNGNILFALDGVDPSKIRVFPIDHSLASFALRRGQEHEYQFDAILRESKDIYSLTMPALTKLMKEDDLLALFRNEANALRESIKDGNIQLSGKELQMIVTQWGSLNNYRAAINTRLDAMLNPNGDVHSRFLRILKPSFWDN